MEGVIFDIKRFAIHDGPGIRTTVFFKGCPLHCWWCHNPESRAPRVEYVSGKKENGSCTQLGHTISDKDLLQEIMRDRIFYETSSGGVTFSGGEPTLQHQFLHTMLRLCKKESLHTAVDTSGYVDPQKLKQIIPWTDLFLFDIKHMVDEAHHKNTGVSNQTIFSNLQLLIREGKEIFIRFPLVPGFNDSEAHIDSLAAYLEELKEIRQVNILPYHRLGQSKYRKYGINSSFRGTEPPSIELLERIKDQFRNYNLPVVIGG